jgi:hypothetical protein
MFSKNKIVEVKGGLEVVNYVRHIRGHPSPPFEIKIIII